MYMFLNVILSRELFSAGKIDYPQVLLADWRELFSALNSKRKSAGVVQRIKIKLADLSRVERAGVMAVGLGH